MFDSGVCCKEKWDVSLFGVKGLNFLRFFITTLLFKNAKFCFVIPDFQAFLRHCGTQGTLKKLEDHMAHPTEEQNVGTSSTSVN